MFAPCLRRFAICIDPSLTLALVTREPLNCLVSLCAVAITHLFLYAIMIFSFLVLIQYPSNENFGVVA